MFLKIMDDYGNIPAPDSDSRRSYRLLADVTAVKFTRYPEAPEPFAGSRAYVTFTDSTTESFDVPNNVYVMNDKGQTISSFSSLSLTLGEVPADAR